MSNSNDTTLRCGEKITIICGECPPDSTGGVERPPAGVPGTSPPVAPPCAAVTVAFESLIVDDAGSNLPFAFLEEGWALNFVANGQVASLPPRTVKTGDQIPIGLEVDARIGAPSGTLQISAGGTIHVAGLPLAPLPLASRTLGASENWGFGSLLQLSASGDRRAYRVRYSIRCQMEAQARTSVTLRQEAIAFVRQELSSVPEARDLSAELALNVFIQRAESWGFRLKGLDGDHLVWEGKHNFATVLAHASSTKSLLEKKNG